MWQRCENATFIGTTQIQPYILYANECIIQRRRIEREQTTLLSSFLLIAFANLTCSNGIVADFLINKLFVCLRKKCIVQMYSYPTLNLLRDNRNALTIPGINIICVMLTNPMSKHKINAKANTECENNIMRERERENGSAAVLLYHSPAEHCLHGEYIYI